MQELLARSWMQEKEDKLDHKLKGGFRVWGLGLGFKGEGLRVKGKG